MTQELKLLRIKVKYLEDRINVLEMCVSRINNILGRFQMTEATGFEDIDKFRDADTMESDHELI